MPPPNTLQVTATLVPVARELHALPGQSIMVVAGVCVGIYTGEQAAQAAPETSAEGAPRRLSLAAASGAWAKETPKPKPKPKAKQKRASPSVSTHPLRIELRERVVAAMRERGGEIPAREIGEAIHHDIGASSVQRHYRGALQDLTLAGMIEIDGPGGTGRIYRLRPGPLDRVEPEPAQAAQSEAAE